MATILYIEDEADTALLVTSMLEEEGLTVRQARDGREALAAIASMTPPTLVLLDLLIPFVNGFEVLTRIRRTTGWEVVPVVMVSADSYWPDIERALVAGANDFLVKSAGVHELVRYVKERVDERTGCGSCGVVQPKKPAASSRKNTGAGSSCGRVVRGARPTKAKGKVRR
ncbi:MAG: response regulator [Nitrospiraceae bacterium]